MCSFVHCALGVVPRLVTPFIAVVVTILCLFTIFTIVVSFFLCSCLLFRFFVGFVLYFVVIMFAVALRSHYSRLAGHLCASPLFLSASSLQYA